MQYCAELCLRPHFLFDISKQQLSPPFPPLPLSFTDGCRACAWTSLIDSGDSCRRSGVATHHSHLMFVDFIFVVFFFSSFSLSVNIVHFYACVSAKAGVCVFVDLSDMDIMV